MSDEKEGKVLDFGMRRRAQIEQTDPVMILANKITKLLADNAETVKPSDQLIAIELSTRALLETLKHAHGEVGLNTIIVDAEDRRRSYHVNWPEHDQSPTVYDDAKLPGCKLCHAPVTLLDDPFCSSVCALRWADGERPR